MASRTRAANCPGGYPARPMPRTPRKDWAAARTAADTEAAKRVLLHVMSYLELLAADVADLMAALDKGPGEASALATRLLDDPDDLWRYNPAHEAEYGAIQLRTDRRLDLTGTPLGLLGPGAPRSWRL
jgi:hypothetical protein